MAQGNEIIVTANPRGAFLEGFVSGTPKPGTIMQVKAATAAIGGRHTWEAYNAAADGNQRLIAVLLPDNLQGKLSTAAYATGDRCFLYCPLPGEDINMLVSAAGTGTGDSVAIADILIADDGTGYLVATTGTPESEPFIAMEALTDVVSTGTLCWCKFTGY